MSKIFKLDTEGLVDASFNCYNYLNYSANEFQKQNDKIIVAYNNGGTNSYITRLNSDGTLDATFSGFSTPCDKIIVNSENKIFISYGSQLKRYGADGVLENTTNFAFTVSKIYQQSCDRLLVQGTLNLNLNNYHGNSDDLKRYDVYSNPSSLVNPPTGQSIQTFSAGGTLQDLTVVGQNILWYSSQSDCGANINNNKLSLSINTSTPLSINTVLVNNTTYYASQTINNIESTYRLPVTATASLNTSLHDILDFKVVNPATDFLKIFGYAAITKIEIYNLLGVKIKEDNLENYSESIEIDLRELVPNMYIVKIYSNNGVNTKKIIKK